MTNHIPRELLPIPVHRRVGPTAYDSRDPDARFEPIKPLRPPQGAPNILLVLLDDAGFGSNSAFGGPCHTRHSSGFQKTVYVIRFHNCAVFSDPTSVIDWY